METPRKFIIAELSIRKLRIFISANNTSIISTDEDPSLRIESSAIVNLRGVSTNLNKYIVFTMQTYKKLNIHIIHDTLRANHFTRLKLKLITNEQLEVMFSGLNKCGLGTMAVLKLKLSQLNEELLLAKGKHDLTKGKPTKTVRTCIFIFVHYTIYTKCSITL